MCSLNACGHCRSATQRAVRFHKIAIGKMQRHCRLEIFQFLRKREREPRFLEARVSGRPVSDAPDLHSRTQTGNRITRPSEQRSRSKRSRRSQERLAGSTDPISSPAPSAGFSPELSLPQLQLRKRKQAPCSLR